MRSPHEPQRTAGGGLRSVRLGLAALLLGSLAVLALATGCGEDAAVTAPATPGAPVVSPAVPADGAQGPPKATDGVCERTTADRKSLPSWARITVKRFVAAVDAGDRATMRALLDPASAAETLAGLRPVTRLSLLALEDRY